MTDVDPIIELFRHRRRKKGLSQLAVANRAGVAQITISRYEKGLAQPRLDILRKILPIVGLDLRAVVPGHHNGGPKPTHGLRHQDFVL